MRMSARARLAIFAGALALAACTPATDGTNGETVAEGGAVAASEIGEAQDNCLLLVWQEQESRNEQFDLAHDLANGGAISCATGTSASQFDTALAAIRAAASSQDKAAILDATGLPLLYIDKDGNRRELTDPDDVDAAFSEVFDQEVLQLLREVDLDAITVVPDEGAFVQLGSVWLVVERNGGRPRIVTVNKQALGEAAEAVRERAQAGGGTEAPAKSSE